MRVKVEFAGCQRDLLDAEILSACGDTARIGPRGEL